LQSAADIDFEDLLAADFQSFDNLLAEATFASYLLGFDTAAEECAATIAGSVKFAEGDKKKTLTRRRKIRVVDYKPNEKPETAAEITDGKSAPFGLRFDVPPAEAIDYFKRKKVLPAKDFYKLGREARAGAFTISNVYKDDVTAALQQELIDALEQGRTQQDVIKRFNAILDGAGHERLGDAHLETVFRTATQMAYGVGRRRAMEEVAEDLPIWEYSAVGDDRTRPTHIALDGLQFPANHPFWDKYYGPWDFRCRCTVIAVLTYRKGYDRTRPNPDSIIDYNKDGLPDRGNVAGTPVQIKTSGFVGVPRQASLEKVLTDSAERALDSRKRPSKARSG